LEIGKAHELEQGRRLNDLEVVVNHEQQYSIWSDFKAIPDGWQTVGKAGSKEACLTYIKEVWTDMRPFSLHKDIA
jgi:MbtH protein